MKACCHRKRKVSVVVLTLGTREIWMTWVAVLKMQG
jgi:hypothetical protein